MWLCDYLRSLLGPHLQESVVLRLEVPVLLLLVAKVAQIYGLAICGRTP